MTQDLFVGDVINVSDDIKKTFESARSISKIAVQDAANLLHVSKVLNILKVIWQL